MRPTFHLLPAAAWDALTAADDVYEAPSLGTEGFIHCTDGVDALIDTANRYYLADPRPYVALTIDLDAVGSPWRLEDPARIYPHVHGPIARASIIEVRAVQRASDGTFLALTPPAAEP